MTSLSLPFQFGWLVLLGATPFTISVTSFQTSIPIAALWSSLSYLLALGFVLKLAEYNIPQA